YEQSCADGHVSERQFFCGVAESLRRSCEGFWRVIPAVRFPRKSKLDPSPRRVHAGNEIEIVVALAQPLSEPFGNLSDRLRVSGGKLFKCSPDSDKLITQRRPDLSQRLPGCISIMTNPLTLPLKLGDLRRKVRTGLCERRHLLLKVGS